MQATLSPGRMPMWSGVQARRVGHLAVDMAIAATSLVAAYVLVNEGRLSPVLVDQLLAVLPLALALRLASSYGLGLHRQVWRYVSLGEAAPIAVATLVGSVTLAWVAPLVLGIPIAGGILALDGALNLLGTWGARASCRALAERGERAASAAPRRRVLLVGAGQIGSLIAREVQRVNAELELVGFVDDHPAKLGMRVQGVEVLGRTGEIPAIVAARRVDEVIICINAAPPATLRALLAQCHASQVVVKRLPGLQDLIGGRIELGALRRVEIHDLLGRAPVVFDREDAASYLQGRVVMVTGAGGSIGSELCRQIARVAPRRLVLVGRGEYSIYTIEAELRAAFAGLEILPVIADVRDSERMADVFAQHRPQVVFHAAAHKHVPLMEANPSEAVLNNTFGTRVVAELADRHGAEAFVLVSTDKAVNPTSVMGASKRVAELVVRELAGRSRTRFLAVRFGNVLGSRGSVVPLFQRQIEAGGPITITHPDIIRYFMTIPEAAQLVLQAGAIGRGGETFVLDMGEPVRIVDLAADLIKLAGLEPGRDIEIKFTGLRPGEKLFEELLTAEEGTAATCHQKIFVAQPERIVSERLRRDLDRLRLTARTGDAASIRRALQRLVPTYTLPQEDAVPAAPLAS